jgi:hypothetical protein
MYTLEIDERFPFIVLRVTSKGGSYHGTRRKAEAVA